MAFDYGNANKEQKLAISTTEGPLLIIAGPGTGKTYTLVKRIVSLNSGNMLTKLEFTGFVGFFFFCWGRNGDVSATLF